MTAACTDSLVAYVQQDPAQEQGNTMSLVHCESVWRESRLNHGALLSMMDSLVVARSTIIFWLIIHCLWSLSLIGTLEW